MVLLGMATKVRARQLYLARQARYNGSAKGQARNRKYEDAHPERKERWSVIMEVKARDRR